MGAVQKLATVVIIGLVAMATVLVVYLADEPNRRGSETTEQEALAIERGTSLYITYCLQCHGPSGYGAQGDEEPKRVGARINQDPNMETDVTPLFQSDDPVMQARAEAFIRFRITYGQSPDPRIAEKAMPAFGQDLNVEEINDLVYLMMHGDWNYIYNESVLATGHTQAQADCDADPTNTEACELAHEEDFALYPTVPPAADDEEASDDSGSEDAASPAAAADGSVVIEAQDPFSWSTTAVTVKPGDTITVVNAGALEHDFAVDEWGIHEVLTADPITITIPEDAEPGEYTFYCTVPGHKESGMVGTITVEAP